MKETIPESCERAKRFLEYLKESSSSLIIIIEGNEGKCFGYLTHGTFLSLIFQLLTHMDIRIKEKGKYYQ